MYKKEINVIKSDNYMDVKFEDKCIRLPANHDTYLRDMEQSFNEFFNSVGYEEKDGIKFVDFSGPKEHNVKGYDLHPIMFPSMSEPISEINPCLSFANLNEDSVVIDLGAYSGLSSILFDMQISKNNKNAKGRVIAVEPDINSIKCVEHNFKLYKEATGRTIEIVNAAAWGETGEIEFRCEGNMGSRGVLLNETICGTIEKVKCYTLSDFAKMFNLEKIDFVKVDIEGGELTLFNDERFFEKYSPKMYIEVHPIAYSFEFRDTIESYGYSWNMLGTAC